MKEVAFVFSIQNRQSITYWSIKDYYLHEYHASLSIFKKNAAAYLETQEFKFFFEKLKRIRNELCAHIKFYRRAISEENFSYIQREIDIKSQIFLNLKEDLRRIKNALEELVNQESGAIIQCLEKEIIKDRTENYCIVTKREMQNEDKQKIFGIFFRFKLTILSESDFRSSDKYYDNVIFVGNENYFHLSSNNTTRAKKINYICQDIYRNEFSDNSIFANWDEQILSTVYEGVNIEYRKFLFIEENQIIENAEAEQKLNFMEEEGINSSLAAELLVGAENNQVGENVKSSRIKAQLFELENPYFVFLKKSKGLKDVLNRQGEFCRKRISELKEGDYLLWSSAEGKDEIEAYADYLFKSEGIDKDRMIQKKLKHSIAKLVNKHSVKKLCKFLESKGMKNISETKLKHLLLPSSFKLQNNKEFWQFLFILTKGDERQTRLCYDASRRLSAYHIRAGRMLRREMRNKIRSLDILSHSENELRISIEEEFHLTLTWQRINYVNPDTVTIPEIYEGRLININQLEGVSE